MIEPFGMFFHVRMVGGTLIGDVEGDLHALVTGGRHEFSKIRKRAKLRVNGFVPSLPAADRPGRTRGILQRRKRIVRTFPVRGADGMNGRKIQNVESEFF